MFKLRPILSFAIALGCCLSMAQKSSVRPFLANELKDFANVRDLAFMPATKEVILTAQDYAGQISVLVQFTLVDGSYQNPEVLPFSGLFMDLEPFFSPDGLELYFASNRPIKSTGEAKDFDIWKVKRSDLESPWGEPQNLGKTINTEYDEFYPAITISGNLYLTISKNPEQKDDIYVARYDDGTYSSPEPVAGPINTSGYEFNAFIAPDESFMIFSGYNRPDGLGGGDLYISFREKGDQWSEPMNLGKEINSNKLDYCPFVDINSGILYFTSNRISSDLSAQNITIDELMETLKRKEGLSRIYQFDISELLRPKN